MRASRKRGGGVTGGKKFFYFKDKSARRAGSKSGVKVLKNLLLFLKLFLAMEFWRGEKCLPVRPVVKCDSSAAGRKGRRGHFCIYL